MLRNLRARARWGAGQTDAGPVWPPPADSGQAQVLRVERNIHEVVETVGTADQIARSGVVWDDRRRPVQEHAGELPAGGRGGLVKDAFVILQSLELWLVRIVQAALLFGARHPRAVVWAAGLWWLSVVVGP